VNGAPRAFPRASPAGVLPEVEEMTVRSSQVAEASPGTWATRQCGNEEDPGRPGLRGAVPGV